MNHTRKLLFLTALLTAGGASAETTATFIMPDGTVGPTETIEVWVRLTTDTGFFFNASDPNGDGNYLLDPGLVPTGAFSIDANGGSGGFVNFDEITEVFTNTSYTCSGSFSAGGTSVCPPGDFYEFSFGSEFNFLTSYSLGAGESQDFLFGTFTPLPGGAAPGTYNFFAANYSITFEGTGTDDFGDPLDLTARVTFASTCVTDDTSCDFSRTVVPIPAAVWLFGSALLGMLGFRTRRT